MVVNVARCDQRNPRLPGERHPFVQKLLIARPAMQLGYGITAVAEDFAIAVEVSGEGVVREG